MQNYIDQLLEDIAVASSNLELPFAEEQLELHDWISDEEEDRSAPVRNLQEWTGIFQEMLPPAEMLSDDQLDSLLLALKKMLDVYNWSFVLQTEVPGRIQYAAIRDHFDQEATIKRWHPGFFSLCRPGTEHGKCALGEYCQCAFYAELFAGMVDDELDPEEERARALEIEIRHLKGKYGDEWMKYYPYHLDSNFDDDDGNPYNYGFDDDEEENDNWWRK